MASSERSTPDRRPATQDADNNEITVRDRRICEIAIFIEHMAGMRFVLTMMAVGCAGGDLDTDTDVTGETDTGEVEGYRVDITGRFDVADTIPVRVILLDNAQTPDEGDDALVDEQDTTISRSEQTSSFSVSFAGLDAAYYRAYILFDYNGNGACDDTGVDRGWTLNAFTITADDGQPGDIVLDETLNAGTSDASAICRFFWRVDGN